MGYVGGCKGFGRVGGYVGGVTRPGMVWGCCDGDDILVRNVLRIIRDKVERGGVGGSVMSVRRERERGRGICVDREKC